MLIITRQQFAVAVIAFALMAAVILLDLPAGFGVATLAATLLSGLLVTLQGWEEHSNRLTLVQRSTDNLKDGRMVIRLQAAGLAPITLHVSDLIDTVKAAQREARWDRLQVRNVPVSGSVRLIILTHGDSSVVNFRPTSGVGYRVIVPTKELQHLLPR
ncbi:hypothetical protein J2Y00_003611 [Deinococcus soli (ex Cha et al. 2016)]|uniref:Uncharacterized protein n=1 Tax=Deinococcus soli (ex Cha et al. 2016) TaxID=1309411 RepID=A0AAE3XGZ3_9DEIO|nr:hypothetical protein [Deinococcus soli (ex Cha et al. 2016)]MDR6220000.1 hypothetical protein [Deinococcus soli (ex Cha et al. 2016)]